MAAITRNRTRSIAVLCTTALASAVLLTLGEPPALADETLYIVEKPTTSAVAQPGELGWAIELANATAGKNTIDIRVDEIILGANLPTITDDITVLGNGSVVNGNFFSYSAFAVTSGSAEISNIEVREPNSAGVYVDQSSGDASVLTAVDVTGASGYAGISISSAAGSSVRVVDGTVRNNNIGIEINSWSGGTVEVTGTSIEANTASGISISASNDANITINDVTLDGDLSGSQGIDSQQYSSSKLTIRDTTISAHSTKGLNALVYANSSLEVLGGTTISSNAEEGIYVYGDGAVLIDETTIASNGFDDEYPGIDIDGLFDDGSVSITRSTISGNAGDGIIADIADDSILNISNSTITGNGVNGIDIDSESRFTLRHSTITRNVGGGVLVDHSGESAMLSHSIIAANDRRMQQSDLEIDGRDVTVEWSVVGHFRDYGAPATPALIEGTGVQWDVLDPGLHPLADNGGLTLTQLLTTDSSALAAGNPNISGAPSTDQRGLPRVDGGRIDIGAVEVQSQVPNPSTEPAALLPATGFDSAWLLLGSLLLLVPGLGFLSYALLRRRAEATSPSID